MYVRIYRQIGRNQVFEMEVVGIGTYYVRQAQSTSINRVRCPGDGAVVA